MLHENFGLGDPPYSLVHSAGLSSWGRVEAGSIGRFTGEQPHTGIPGAVASRDNGYEGLAPDSRGRRLNTFQPGPGSGACSTAKGQA